MNLQLTSKEKTMLQDQLKHETICIQKYEKYAAEAGDPKLKQLFNSLAAHEQQHYATIQQMLNGQAPNLQQGQEGQQQQSLGPNQNAAEQSAENYLGHNIENQQSQLQMSQEGQYPEGQYQAEETAENAAEQSAENYLGHNMQMQWSNSNALMQGDAALCADSVMTEKFVSGSYDTGVFQSSNQQVIQALQHIQKEEQEHGQQLKQFMESKGLQ